MLDSPFFGRVDFCYDGDDEPEIFYIGIGNFAERPGELPLIYDWRSPVSGLFYDFDRGPASYLAPGGEMTGEICSKWQYKIRDGKMIYGFESDVKIDDDILKAELGSNGEVQLKNIIRTIQKEQNAIIRNTKDRILVIQGAAGSGKTSVALHRIAYLLYHDRQKLKSSNILILSPNGVFSDYISHILPELGEENIQEMSFDLFAYRKLQDTAADCEDRCDQIEREMRDPKAAERFALKQSQAFVDQMEGFALELEDELMNFSDVSYKSFVKSESEIITLFYDKLADIPLLSRMNADAENFFDKIETLLNRDMWMNPLSDVMANWWIWKYGEDGTRYLTTECIENLMLFIPFTILLFWTAGKKILKKTTFLNIVWTGLKITFVFSLSIELLQLFLRLGTFQVSDLTYNTLGGGIGGAVYWIGLQLSVRRGAE